jgi:iron complex outermembrane receptor protein
MYYKDDVTPDENLPNSNFGPGKVLTQESFTEQHTDAWAGYIDATWNVSDKIAINAGGRYTKESKDYSAFTLRYPAGASSTPTIGFPVTEKSVSFSRFTPRASIRYELAPRTNLYASYSKGFRSGYFAFSLPPTPAQWVPVKPEDVDSFEVGFKTAGSNYRFELSAFYYDYRNLHVSLTARDPTCGDDPACARVLSLFGNAPKSKIKGIEGSFEYSPMENLTLRGGASWLHARYGKFPNANGVGVNPAFVGTTVNSDPLKTFLNVGQVQDWTGLRMSRAPDFTANLGAEYRIPVREGGISMSAHVNYTSRYVVTNPSTWGPLLLGTPYADSARKQRFTEGAYALLSAQVTWTHPDGHFYVQGFGTNLTDHRYRMHYTGTATTITNGVAGTNGGTYMPMAEPRVYGGRIGYKF